ncbi:hypothetical protein PIB30_020166, partial [Stylosanthes scabra]|nr:hypothetical protein [Stylosanthes scabra]
KARLQHKTNEVKKPILDNDDEVQVTCTGETRMYADRRNQPNIQEEEISNKEGNSISTKCLFDDRCSEEVIKETQLRLFGDPIEGALHDTGGINHF